MSKGWIFQSDRCVLLDGWMYEITNGWKSSKKEELVVKAAEVIIRWLGLSRVELCA